MEFAGREYLLIRLPYILLIIFGSLFTFLYWNFAAGWAGQYVWLPDVDLLSSSEWPIWIVAMVFMYGPPLAVVWSIYKLAKYSERNEVE